MPRFVPTFTPRERPGVRPSAGSTLTAGGRSVRRAGWALCALFVVAFLSAWLTGLAPQTQSLVAEVALTATMVFGVVATLVAGLRRRGPERGFWLRVTAIMTLAAVGQAFWAWYATTIDPAGPGTLSLDTVFELAAFAVFLSLVWSFTARPSGTELSKVTYFVDVLSAALIGTFTLWAFVMEPVFESYGAPVSAALIAAAYPWGAAVIVMWVFTQLFGLQASRWRQWERLAVAGFVLFAAGVAFWPVWYLSTHFWHDRLASMVIDLAWLGGTALMGMAALYRLTGSEPWTLTPMPPARLSRPVAVRLLPVLIALVAVVVLGAGTWLLPAGSFARSVAAWGAMLITAAAVVRTGSEVARAGQVEARSGVDPVTGLPGPRVFHEALSRCEGVATEDDPVSVVVMDLDDFEHANTVSGYEEGDALLARAARAMLHMLQGEESLYRMGGDEFALLLPGMDATAAAAFTEHLLSSLRRIEDPAGAPLRASAGVATCPTHMCTREHVVHAAERALLAAKLAGKDQVVVWTPVVEEGFDPAEIQQRAREQSYLATVRATAAAVDARATGYAGHSRHVGAMSLKLARRLGLDDATARLVETAGQLHDVGKVGVPDAALSQAPEALTEDLRRRLHEHPMLGATIVASTSLSEVPPWIAAHHERWDGTGYPEGRAGEDIPLAARIVAVADAYDHLMATLPPSARCGRRTAVAEQMRAEMGAAYDPLVVLHLLSAIAEEEVGAS